MKLLISGATGFLGAELVEAAAKREHEVVALVRRSTSRIDRLAAMVVSTELPDLPAEKLPDGVDAVVNLATGSDGMDARLIDVAVQGALHLLAWARDTGVRRFLHVSSMSVLSAACGMGELEPHPERRGVYANSKTRAEEALRSVDLEGAPLELTVVRPGLVVGSGMKNPLGGTAVRLPGGLALGIGRAGQGLPFVTIEDTVDGLLELLDVPPVPGAVRVHHLLSGSPPPKREVLAVSRRLTGWPRRQLWIPEPIACSVASIAEVALGIRGRKRHLPYAVRRLYRFEPRELPDDFWPVLGRGPRGDLRSALMAAFTSAGAAPCVRTIGYRERVDRLLPDRRLERPLAALPLVLVGAGGIVSDVHVAALGGLGSYEPLVVVDPDRTRAEQVARRFPGCITARSVDEVEPESWDRWSAVIAAPGQAHEEIACTLLARGASVLIEKPAAPTLAAYAAIVVAAKAAETPVSVFHNYRLRPASRRLWQFLHAHNVGALVSANVGFRAPGRQTQRARWMTEEKRYRILIMDLGIHFLDLAFLVGGELDEVLEASVTNDRLGSTLAVHASARLAEGARLDFALDLSGTAQRTQITFEFERASCALNFFPDGFRVLPRRSHPLDDLLADATRVRSAVGGLVRRGPGGVSRRAIPHREIYLRHRLAVENDEVSNPFSLFELGSTMRSLEKLCALVYDTENVPLS
ncbi:MAG: NAD-dependent epimerase/dehydratase family protein [Gaiellaceae bacterium]